jgi:hypothetical protein
MATRAGECEGGAGVTAAAVKHEDDGNGTLRFGGAGDRAVDAAWAFGRAD